MSKGNQTDRRWWGDFEVPLGSCAGWRIGPLQLRIQRDSENWTIAEERDPDPFVDAISVGQRATPIALEEETARIAALGSSGKLRLLPAHADRPVVVTPESHFALPPRRSARLFVSLPLWFQVYEAGQGRPIHDQPVFRPSDTWHGGNTMDGEVCYSSRTRARADVTRFPPLPHRAVAPLEVRNSSDEDLPLERVKVPVAHLSVLVSPEGRLWTETIVFERAAGEEHAEVRIDATVPRQAGTVDRVAEPRRPFAEKKFVWQAFGQLFG